MNAALRFRLLSVAVFLGGFFLMAVPSGAEEAYCTDCQTECPDYWTFDGEQYDFTGECETLRGSPTNSFICNYENGEQILYPCGA